MGTFVVYALILGRQTYSEAMPEPLTLQVCRQNDALSRGPTPEFSISAGKILIHLSPSFRRGGRGALTGRFLVSPLMRRGGRGVVRWVGTFMVARSLTLIASAHSLWW